MTARPIAEATTMKRTGGLSPAGTGAYARPAEMRCTSRVRGRKRIASVRRTSANVTALPAPAFDEKSRGYVSARPRNIAPTTVHGRLVSRPIRAAVKAAITTIVIEIGSKLIRGVIRTPAIAPMAEPATHETDMTRLTLIPHSRAASGSSATARIDVPKVVHRSTAAVPSARPRATTIVVNSSQPTTTDVPGNVKPWIDTRWTGR